MRGFPGWRGLVGNPARSVPAAEADRPETLTRRRYKGADTGHQPGGICRELSAGVGVRWGRVGSLLGPKLWNVWQVGFGSAARAARGLGNFALPLRSDLPGPMLLPTLEINPHPTCLPFFQATSCIVFSAAAACCGGAASTLRTLKLHNVTSVASNYCNRSEVSSLPGSSPFC